MKTSKSGGSTVFDRLASSNKYDKQLQKKFGVRKGSSFKKAGEVYQSDEDEFEVAQVSALNQTAASWSTEHVVDVAHKDQVYSLDSCLGKLMSTSMKNIKVWDV